MTTATATRTQTPSTSRQQSQSATTTDPNDAALGSAVNNLKLLADSTRLRILYLLDQGDTNVGGICAALSQSQPAVSHHLSLLRVSGAVAATRHGKTVSYALTSQGRRAVKAARMMAG